MDKDATVAVRWETSPPRSPAILQLRRACSLGLAAPEDPATTGKRPLAPIALSSVSRGVSGHHHDGGGLGP